MRLRAAAAAVGGAVRTSNARRSAMRPLAGPRAPAQLTQMTPGREPRTDQNSLVVSCARAPLGTQLTWSAVFDPEMCGA